MKSDRENTRIRQGGICRAGLVVVVLASLNSGIALAGDPVAETPDSRSGPPEQFRAADADGSGKISLDEHLATQPEAMRTLAERNFNVADSDADGELTVAEFLALVGTAVPDPVVEFSRDAIRKWRSILKPADKNDDGKLSAAEWPQEVLRKELAPFGEVGFAVWDADGDGQVDDAEAERLLEAGYGIRHPAGQLFRMPNGVVVYLSWMRGADQDGDERLSEAEFTAVGWLGKEENTRLFHKLDTDHDRTLTYAELAVLPNLNSNALDVFRTFDRDLDGRLSADELASQNPPAQGNARRLQLGLAAFDEDGDGKFSLREYRLSPVGAMYVAIDVLNRQDLNHDGMITWKEFYGEPSPLFIGLVWELFQRYDRNHDGQLTFDEFEFGIDADKVPVDLLFGVEDLDKNGRLTREEHLATQPEAVRKVAERNFTVADGDGDGELTVVEYLGLVGTAVPDPIVEFSRSALRKWRSLLKPADKNNDGKLSAAEWPQEAVRKELAPFGEVGFAAWDADRDGQVDDGEAQRLLEVGYGVRHTNGQLMRMPNGVVVYWSWMRGADQDGDQRVSEAEFTAAGWLGKEENPRLFHRLDTDHDQTLTYAELAVVPTLNSNVLEVFRTFDKDLDGRLSAEELASQNPPAMGNARRLELGLAAFDEDGDGTFALREYRLAPVGAMYVAIDVLNPQDLNHDGKISWKEFYKEQSPLFIGLAWELFQRHDRNRDSELTYDEFDFAIDPDKVPVGLLFRIKDRNRDGKLEFAELFTEPKPATEASQDLERYHFRMATAEDKFLADDLDDDGSLSLEEFSWARQVVLAAGQSSASAAKDRTGGGRKAWIRESLFAFNIIVLAVGARWLLRRTNH